MTRRYYNLGPAIRMARKAAKVSLQALADGSCLSDGQMTRIELGGRWIDEGELARVCERLGIDEARILTAVRDDDAERLRIEYGDRLFTLSSPDGAHLVAPATSPEEAAAFVDDYASCLPPIARPSTTRSSSREAEAWIRDAAASVRLGGVNYDPHDTGPERVEQVRNWPVLL